MNNENRCNIERNHNHEFLWSTKFAENGEHVHFVEASTSCNDGHSHCFEVATLISNPLV